MRWKSCLCILKTYSFRFLATCCLQFRKWFPPTKWSCEFNAFITVPVFQWLVGPCEVSAYSSSPPGLGFSRQLCSGQAASWSDMIDRFHTPKATPSQKSLFCWLLSSWGLQIVDVELNGVKQKSLVKITKCRLALPQNCFWQVTTFDYFLGDLFVRVFVCSSGGRMKDTSDSWLFQTARCKLVWTVVLLKSF